MPTHSIEHMVYQITESLPTYPEHQKSSYSKNQRTPLDLPAAYTPSGRGQCSRIRLELVSHSPLHPLSEKVPMTMAHHAPKLPPVMKQIVHRLDIYMIKNKSHLYYGEHEKTWEKQRHISACASTSHRTANKLFCN